MRSISHGHFRYLGFSGVIVLFLLFFLCSSAFFDPNLYRYPVLRSHQTFAVGETTYELIRETYNPETHQIWLRFSRQEKGMTTSDLKIQANHVDYHAGRCPVRVILVSDMYVVMVVSSIPHDFDLAKLLVTEKRQPMGNEAPDIEEINKQYLRKVSMTITPKVKEETVTAYRQEDFTVHI